MAGRERLEVSLYGTVQGVGFRMFAAQHAQRLGLTGFVRNDPSGRRVEVVAEGPRAALEQLLHHLRRGPAGAAVSHVEARWRDSTGEYGRFLISH